MAGKKLPYDAEVEYLESDGNGTSSGPIINTLSIPNQNVSEVRYDVKFSLTGYTKGVVLGCQNAGYSNPRTYLFYKMDSATSYNTLDIYSGDKLSGASITLPVGSIFDGYVIQSLTSNTLTLYGNNGTFNLVVATSGEWKNTNYPIRLFGGCTGMNIYDTNKVRIYRCSAHYDGIKVFDFIPVRVGTTGYMYDKVSGQLFGNAGTGNFILGNDK